MYLGTSSSANSFELCREEAPYDLEQGYMTPIRSFRRDIFALSKLTETFRVILSSYSKGTVVAPFTAAEHALYISRSFQEISNGCKFGVGSSFLSKVSMLVDST